MDCGLLVIEGDDPQEKRNALSDELVKEIIAALEDFKRQRVRAAILRSQPGARVWSAGHDVAVYNRTQERTDDFLADEAKDTTVIGTTSLEELVAALSRPRKVMLMVKAGGPVDAVIGQ